MPGHHLQRQAAGGQVALVIPVKRVIRVIPVKRVIRVTPVKPAAPLIPAAAVAWAAWASHGHARPVPMPNCRRTRAQNASRSHSLASW